MLSTVVPGLHRVDLGIVNAYLVEAEGGLIMIDTGLPGSEDALLRAIADLGFAPADVDSVIVTHHHPDHAGALAAILDATGAEAWMHPLDATEVRVGNGFRPYRPASGILNWVLEKVVIRPTSDTFEPAPVAQELHDGGSAPGGLRVIHTPGHSAGQIALLWPDHGGVLIAADACTNLPVLTLSVIYEDLALGRQTLRQLAALEFDTAVFGHGEPIVEGASARFGAAFL